MRLTTYHPCSVQRQEIRGLNLPGSPWAISTACCGRDLYLYLIYIYTFILHIHVYIYKVKIYIYICIRKKIGPVSLLVRMVVLK